MTRMNDPRLFLRKGFTALSVLFAQLARRTYRSPREARVDQWYADRGDATLRTEYPLAPDSVVFDLGGYRGDWAVEMFSRYGCRIYVFEPVPEYFHRIRRRFERNDRIKAFPFGLGSASMDCTVNVAEEGSSVFASPNVRGNAVTNIRIECFSDFIRSAGIDAIDLMKVNIEGGEYDLLEHVLASGFAAKIGDLQIQFHDFVPDAERRMRAIQRRLAETHDLTYQYEFVWENWKRR